MLGSGALAGGLAGLLLNSKHVRKHAGTALQVGAAAVLGGLAYKAYQDYRAGRRSCRRACRMLSRACCRRAARHLRPPASRCSPPGRASPITPRRCCCAR
ncbi:MAG: tellurite resistance TerB family protein [Methylacidiphilales bacterium]|nr:tellurite resistance TerB family protein [Candidatus Methylacidiphilales bacterium]